MNPTAIATFLRMLSDHLVNHTSDPHERLCLVRVMARRPITGGPIHGWHA